LKYNGFGSVSAEWGLPKCLWLKEQEPTTWRDARHICDAVDWLINRLTGEWTASINVAAPKYHHDRNEGGFPVSLLEAVGLEDFRAAVGAAGGCRPHQPSDDLRGWLHL